MPWPRKIPHGEQLSSTGSVVKTARYLHKRDFLERAVLTMINNLDVMPAHERDPKSLVERAIRMHELIQEEMKRGT